MFAIAVSPTRINRLWGSDEVAKLRALPREPAIRITDIDPARSRAYVLAVTEAAASCNGDFMKESRG